MEIGQVQSSLRLVISLKYGVLIIVNYKCKQYELSFNQPLGLGETGFITKQNKNISQINRTNDIPGISTIVES